MKLFIDANIFLDFYMFTNEDLTKLEQLVRLIESEKIDLLLPRQIMNETYRNRERVINDSFKKFRQEKFTLNFPSYCKEYEQYDPMKDCLKQLKEFHNKMIEKLQSDVEEERLLADVLIRELFDSATKMENTPKLVGLARKRVELENPPGKKGSIGDAVNWESLLMQVPRNKDLYFISNDSDFRSPIGENRFNEFLQKEWGTNKKSELHFYRELSEFFRDNELEIDLKIENEKDDLIRSLGRSSNFATTHALIAKLSAYDFTQKQAEDLVDILFMNSQVYQIGLDSDILEFYQDIYDNFPFLDQRHELEIMLNKAYQVEEMQDYPFE